MSSIDTEEQSKYPPERLRGLTPYKPGQSGNPGGIRKGTVIVSEAYNRLGALPLEQLRAYQPRSAIEHGIKQAVLRAAEAKDWQAAHAALKEITDRTEGKAIQRRVDLTADEVVSKAKLAYQLGLRLRDNLAAHCREIACNDECAAKMSTLIPFDDSDVLQAVLSTVDEQYHDAVIRELEAMQ
jgi:hypothetical protein